MPPPQLPLDAPRQSVRTSSSIQTQSTRDVPNIVIMVGGTVDPGNMDPKARSASYRNPSISDGVSDPDWYWGSNKPFRDALAQLRKKYNNLHLFVAHGWTGDNAVDNRRLAGAYLADRLCGGNGEPAYYPRFLREEVSFHLIGHSHGGNVINEFTRRAATSPDWPATWKIRSITYLSTPFFSRLHPVHTGALHSDCRILNVFCKYDLTQRVIADFSLKPLNDLLRQAGFSELTELCEGLLDGMGFDRERLKELILSVRPRDADDRWYVWDPRLEFSTEQGAWLYRTMLELLGRLRQVFTKARQIIDRLNQGIEVPVPRELAGKMESKRQVMSNRLAEQFRLKLNRLESGVKTTESAFKTRQRSGRYPVKSFFDDLHVIDFFQPLIEFIAVDPNTLRGPLWDLVAQLLQEQIDEFDNTSQSPAAQLRNTRFASRIVSLDISRKDPYSVEGKDAVFGKFVSRLEGIEAKYAQAPSQRTLLDMVFILLAHVEPMSTHAARWATLVDWYEGVVRRAAWLKSKLNTLSRAEQLFLRLLQVLEGYALIIQARHCGQLQVDDTRQKLPAGVPPLGSLPYLAVHAHSTSRQDLYPEVKRALEGQFDTRTRSGR